jgi:hypothetical protein
MADQHELRHQLDLEVLFSAAAREFREQPQFAELLRQVGLDSYLDQSALEVSDLVMW